MVRSGKCIRIAGRVQGVGFRPFVWQLAKKAGLTGRVLNDASGVRIDVWATPDQLHAFIAALQETPPPLARIDTISTHSLSTPAPAHFSIAPSGTGTVRTEITPDAATCPDCLREVFDPDDRRYLYPFTNCTHCGPRLSIVESIPYDRARTSMRTFTMCADCQREYDDPNDRRFHAQPNACPACGPVAWLENAQGKINCADPIAETAKMLKQGQIIAIKGIGGFHLACDATNAETVRSLRERKQRKAKPFAVMCRDDAQIRRYCHLSDEEAELLSAPIAPIVLLKKHAKTSLPGVAPALDRLGVMRPHAPLQHLLLAQLDTPLVMTSGNASGMPQVIDNAQARSDLGGIADAWLMHDRTIVNRLDDSVMRGGDTPAIVRRSRGLVPTPIPLHAAFADAPHTLALGAAQKATFCLVKDGKAIPSQHIGDLTTVETFDDFRTKIALFRDLYAFDPKVIAIDMHPDYLSARWGRQLAKETGAKLVLVQHHHAHFVSTLAEHQIAPDDARTVGLILDGTGWGADGTIWGGEILVADYAGFERHAHFQPIALPGGDAAVRAPWRNLVAHLRAALGSEWRDQIAGTALAERLDQKPVTLIEQMMTAQFNAPLASSAGRLFDAVSAAVGSVFTLQDYEGQAAMELEALVDPSGAARGYSVAMLQNNVLSWGPLWRELISDLKDRTCRKTIATRFHVGLGAALVTVCQRVATEAKTNRIALSGGVMQNRFLHANLERSLSNLGYEVLSQQKVPANDGGISLGQAAIAAHRV